jgi:hypothetical protein
MKNVILTWSLTSLAFVTIITCELLRGDLMVTHFKQTVDAADIFGR